MKRRNFIQSIFAGAVACVAVELGALLPAKAPAEDKRFEARMGIDALRGRMVNGSFEFCPKWISTMHGVRKNSDYYTAPLEVVLFTDSLWKESFCMACKPGLTDETSEAYIDRVNGEYIYGPGISDFAFQRGEA